MFNAVFRRRRTEQTLDDEIRHHIELQTQEYIHAGMTPDEAERKARLRFGSVASVQERCREENQTFTVESVWQDLRFAFRTFLAQPGFTAVVLITLALGIGANTAVFSVLQAVLLKPLPVREPERIAYVWETDRLRGTAREPASLPDYLDMKQRTRSFEHLAAIQRMDVTLTGRGEPERLPSARVTSNYFTVAGVQPVLGRVFGPGEAGVVLSHALWQSRFAGSREVLGSAITLDGLSGTVLGVMAPEVSSLEGRGALLWTALESVRATAFRGQHNTQVLGRLRSGVTAEQAQSELSALMTQLEKEYPADNLGRGALVVAAHEELAGTMRPALQALSVAVLVLLLVACVNVANLLLARASARGHEMAIRVSLGAARGRLIRQLLTESLVLTTAGAALGLTVAHWGVRALIALAPADSPLIDRTEIDSATLLVTAGISLGAWVLFGLAPALRASRMTARSTASAGTLRLRHALVVAEIGMATVLVIFCGLLIRSFWRLHQTDLGYQPQGAIVLRVKLPESRYPIQFPFREMPATTAFYDRLKSSALSVPDVVAASVAMAGPQRSSWTTRVTVEGRPAPPAGEQEEAQYRPADPDYLKATGAPLRRGRFFDSTDDERHPMVAVVNEEFVRRHFPGESPVGRRIVVFGMSRQVVGVMGDIRYDGPGADPSPAMYFPLRQAPFPDISLIVRTTRDPGALASQLRAAVYAADPAVAAFDVMTVERSLSEATSRQRFVMALLSVFGGLALLLAAVGIYGVMTYTVGQRRKEIAVRIALGALPRAVVTQIMRGMLARAAAGIGGGVLIAALVASRLLEPLVYQTSTVDTFTYAVVVAGLMAVSALGSALPARRAVRMDAASALRQD